MDLESVPVDSLRPHPRNPRRGNVALLESSLSRFGQTKPIVVAADGTILAGTHTWLAAKNLGLTSVAVVRRPLDPGSDEALAIVRDDNETSDAAGYDERFLFETLAGLDTVAGTGYGDDDLGDLSILYGDEPPDLLPLDPDDAARRVMILHVPVPLFLWLTERLDALMARWSLDSYTAAVLRAVAEQHDEAVPA